MSETRHDIKTPQAEAREKFAKEDAERKAATKVIKEWVEVKGGKVLLKRVTNNGYEHSWYVGREDKCRDYLADCKKKGILK